MRPVPGDPTQSINWLRLALGGYRSNVFGETRIASAADLSQGVPIHAPRHDLFIECLPGVSAASTRVRQDPPANTPPQPRRGGLGVLSSRIFSLSVRDQVRYFSPSERQITACA